VSLLHPQGAAETLPLVLDPARSALPTCDLWAEDSRGGGAWSVMLASRVWNGIARRSAATPPAAESQAVDPTPEPAEAPAWDAPLVQLFWIRFRDAIRALQIRNPQA